MKYNLKLDNFTDILFSSQQNSFYINNNLFTLNNQFTENNIVFITISFGTQCNYNCLYCMQQTNKNTTNFIYNKNLIKQIKKFTDKRYGSSTQFIFRLWGGEPLLFFDLIKIIVQEIRNYYGICNIVFCTNGSLLDNNKLKWIEDNNIDVTVSYDGVGQYARNEKNIMDAELYDILKYTLYKDQPWQISTIFNKYNSSTKRFLEHMEILFPNSEKIRYAELNYIKIDDEKSLACNLSEDELKNDLKYKLYCIKNNINNGYTNFLKNKLNYISKNINNTQPWCRCFCYYDNYYCIDIEGNMWGCHNTVNDTSTLCGNIFTNVYTHPVYTVHNEFFTKYCKECLLSVVCGGGCCMTNEKYKLINCHKNFYEHFPLFYLLVKTFFNHKLIAYEN